MTELLREYLSSYQLAPKFSEEEVEHYLLPVSDVIDSHVVESPSAHLITLLPWLALRGVTS